MTVGIYFRTYVIDVEVLKKGVETALRRVYYKHHDPDLLLLCPKNMNALYNMLNKFTHKYNVPFDTYDCNKEYAVDELYTANIEEKKVELLNHDKRRV